MRLMTGLLSAAALAAAIPALGGEDLSRRLDDAVCCGHNRYVEAESLFARLQAAGTASPEDDYRAAYAEMRLNRPDRAEPLLRESARRGFTGWKGWPSTDALLERARTVRELAPPRIGAEGGDIEVHAAAPTPWSAPVLTAVPAFARVGRDIYGGRLPPMRLFLFPEFGVYARFHEALFGSPVASAWGDGTANIGTALFTERSRDGRVTRPAGDPETIACVLHEFGHGWANTYFMARHGKDYLAEKVREPWFDEGMADYVASLWDPDFIARRERWLKARLRAGAVPPAFQDLRTIDGFYGHGAEADLSYWTSALLMRRLLGPADKGAPAIRRMLDALAETGSAREAVKRAVGKDPNAEYAALINELRPSAAKQLK